MEIDFDKAKQIEIFVNEKADLAIFSFVKNPEISLDRFSLSDPFDQGPLMVHSKTAFEIKAPYTTADLGELIQKGIDAWNKLEPFTSKRLTIEQHYYKTRGFKSATIGKKLIRAGWNGQGEKFVNLMLPLKTGKGYLIMHRIKLKQDADWMDFADAVLQVIELDITKLPAFKVYQKKLNV